MIRRRFLQLLGLAPVAALTPPERAAKANGGTWDTPSNENWEILDAMLPDKRGRVRADLTRVTPLNENLRIASEALLQHSAFHVQTRDALRRAAGLIEEHGHSKFKLIDERGRLHLGGAIGLAFTGDPLGAHKDALALGALSELARFCPVGNAIYFNDYPTTQAADVVALLRGAAASPFLMCDGATFSSGTYPPLRMRSAN